MKNFDLNNLYDQDIGLHVNAFYHRKFLGFDMELHQHAYMEIMYIEQGKCTIELMEKASQKRVYIKLDKNQFILIQPFVYHKLYIKPKSQCSICTIEFSFDKDNKNKSASTIFLQLLTEIPDLLDVIFPSSGYVVSDDYSEILTNMKQIQVLAQKNRNRAENLLQNLRNCCFIVSIYNAVLNNMHHTQIFIYVDAVYDFIHNHFDNPEFSIDLLAQHIGVHRTYLMNIFKKETETTIIHYLNKIRIERAIILIETSNENFIDIAFACGFNSRQNFYKNFVKVTGEKPIDYKARKKNPNIYNYDSHKSNFINEEPSDC